MPARSFWTLLVTISLTIAGWQLWPHRGAGTNAAARPAGSAAETRQQAILKANIDQPGDPDLARQFARLNTLHFNGVLPAIPVRWEAGLDEVGRLAGRAFTLEGIFGRIGDRTVILLHPKLKTDQAALDRTLSHEMVHAYLYVLGDPSTDHGPAFQSLLRRLADAGAFAGVVASPEEQARLKTWLDEESARLDTERDAIARIGQALAVERAAIDRDGAPAAARVDDYNARAAMLNARVDRHGTDVAAFNTYVARYNLMLSYPDGHDEAGTIRPKDATR